MRALYLVLLIVICLPLQAGEAPELERAVSMFRNNDAAVRRAGSKLADRELRRLLAPLLEDSPARAKMLAGLERAVAELGPPGASERGADLLLEVAKGG